MIIASSSQAPFGRGEDTIVDTSVRRTWQLPPMQFSINNSQWTGQLQALLNRVKDELGCDPNMTVTGELYKLLLYEPGSFFKVSSDLFLDCLKSCTNPLNTHTHTVTGIQRNPKECLAP